LFAAIEGVMEFEAGPSALGEKTEEITAQEKKLFQAQSKTES